MRSPCAVSPFLGRRLSASCALRAARITGATAGCRQQAPPLEEEKASELVIALVLVLAVVIRY